MKFISVLTPRQTLKLINIWPPFLFSGISVVSVNEDITEIVVRKKSNLLTQNYMGTHFGGSLYAMCDPFFAFIILNQLKDDHIVWDTGAEIAFVKATREPVFATFRIPADEVERVRDRCLNVYKVEPEYSAEIVDSKGLVIAQVRKKVYVRRKDAKERFAKAV